MAARGASAAVGAESGQVAFDLRPPRPAHAPRAGGHAVDDRVKLALMVLLQGRHSGLAHAATWEQLRAELDAEGLQVGVVRRLQEAAEKLLEEGRPVVGLSSDGIWWAETAEEVEQSLRESEKRARKSLRRRKLLRRVWMALRGQESIRSVEDLT